MTNESAVFTYTSLDERALLGLMTSMLIGEKTDIPAAVRRADSILREIDKSKMDADWNCENTNST